MKKKKYFCEISVEPSDTKILDETQPTSIDLNDDFSAWNLM